MNLKNFGVIEGRLTRDVEIKTSESGVARTFLSIAVNRNFKNKDGEYDTDFISVVAFGKTAEFIGKHFKKGSAIKIQYTVRSRVREVEIDGNKVNRTVLDLVAESAEFAMLSKSSEKAETSTDAATSVSDNNEFSEIADDDDLPF